MLCTPPRRQGAGWAGGCAAYGIDCPLSIYGNTSAGATFTPATPSRVGKYCT